MSPLAKQGNYCIYNSCDDSTNKEWIRETAKREYLRKVISMSLLQGARLAQSFGEKSREKQIEMFYPEGEYHLNVRISLVYVACVHVCVCKCVSVKSCMC